MLLAEKVSPYTILFLLFLKPNNKSLSKDIVYKEKVFQQAEKDPVKGKNVI